MREKERGREGGRERGSRFGWVKRWRGFRRIGREETEIKIYSIKIIFNKTHVLKT